MKAPQIVVRNISNDFKKEIYTKKRIVYHFTAGLMPGAEVHLGMKDGINVPYIICKRKGQINNYFHPKYWAYHTGVGLCKESIGIEIECWGNLDFIEGYFLPWTGKQSQAVSPERVLYLDKPFRGYSHFELLTDEQVDSVDWLTDMLLNEFPSIEILNTHADIRKTKLDFPPEYAQIYDIINKYNKVIAGTGKDAGIFNAKNPISYTRISNYTAEQIQARINWLIKNAGWNNSELKILIKYRDSK